MKAKSPFDTLTPEEKQNVIHLCDKLTYREVLELISQPKPEGLAIETSLSALCRFYAQWHPLSYQLKVDSQLADVLDESYHESGDKFFRGILALAQQRVFAELQVCASLKEASASIRLLLRLRREYNQLLKMRAGNKSPKPNTVPKDPSESDTLGLDELSNLMSALGELDPTDHHPGPSPSSSPTPTPSTNKSQNTPGGVAQTTIKTAPEIPITSREIPEKPPQNARNSTFSTNSTTKLPPASGPTPTSAATISQASKIPKGIIL